jgi:hypothetical protein
MLFGLETELSVESSSRYSMSCLDEALKEQVDVEISNLLITKKYGKLNLLAITVCCFFSTDWEKCNILTPRFRLAWKRI